MINEKLSFSLLSILVGCVAVILSVFLIQRFKRTKILLVGQAAFIICFAIIIVLNGYNSVIFMNVFHFVFELTVGPIEWIYLPEVLSDI